MNDLEMGEILLGIMPFFLGLIGAAILGVIVKILWENDKQNKNDDK